MEHTNFFMYLSTVEGILIVCMLGWEVFWLRRMYQVLQRMPTAEQLGDMIKMIKTDRDGIKDSFESMVKAFEPVKSMFSSLTGGLIGGPKLFDK